MSFEHATKPQDLGPGGLKPGTGAHTLGASVEVASNQVNDLCTAVLTGTGARERILAWLAEGARELTWALCSIPRERWAADPPSWPGEWPALRHARHLALRESYLTLPTIRHALGELSLDEVPSTSEFERVDAAWDASQAIDAAEDIIRELGGCRFEVLQRVETAREDVWNQLDWLLLTVRQHELEHLAAIWKVALHWNQVALTPCRQASGVTLR